MKRSSFTVLLLLLLTSLFPCVAALAFDIKAGPIYHQGEANEKCPNVCQWYNGWNGNWTTIQWGGMSVCGCNSGLASSNPYDKNAGPIANDIEAATKCVAPCRYYGGWAGVWRDITPNVMSVCQCYTQ